MRVGMPFCRRLFMFVTSAPLLRSGVDEAADTARFDGGRAGGGSDRGQRTQNRG